jgi:prepilin-type N-terminal cleavage/methylation domain-containing protein
MGRHIVKNSDSRSGLTLIELLVTIGVLAIVAGISIPLITNVVETSNERASLQTQTDITDFVSKYSKTGSSGYTYDASTGTFSGYLDLDNDGTASDDEKIEELRINTDRFTVASSAGDAPSIPSEIDFSNPPTVTYAIVDYIGTVTPETLNISGYAGYAITPTNVSAEGFEGAFTWSIREGTLPDGLTLNTSTGVVTGTPTSETSPTTVEIKITDENGVSGTQTHTYEFAPEPTLSPSLTTVTGQAGETITPTSVTLTGYTEPYSWSVSSGSLPAGLDLDTSTGIISGTPTSETQASLTLSLVDANELTGTQTHTFDIAPEPTVSPTSISVSGEAGSAITPTGVTATGFTAPYSWEVTSGTLPDGLSLDSSTGVVSGTPSTEGSSTVSITVTDADGRTASQSQAYNITSPAPLVVMSDSSPGPNENTGGWNTSYSAGTRGPIISVTDDYMALRGPYWTDGNADTVNTFDLTEVSSITIEVSASGVRSSYFYSSFWWKGSDGGWDTYSFGNPSNANFGRTTFTIPITDGGVGSLRLRVTNSDGGYVYLHSVTLNY